MCDAALKNDLMHANYARDVNEAHANYWSPSDNK